MKRFLTPACLVLCLALLVTGFGLLAMDPPEPTVALHRARVTGDEAYRDALEADLRFQIWLRRGLIGGVFVAALMLGVTGFLCVSGTEP